MNSDPITQNTRRRRLWAPLPYESAPVNGQRQQPLRPALLVNPNTGQHRAQGYDRRAYEAILGPSVLIRESESLEALGRVMAELREEGVNAIIVDGGDGTLGAVITEAFYTYGAEALPAFVPLRGGSFNATALNIGVPRLEGEEMLRRLRAAFEGGLAGLTERRVGTLRLHDPRRPRDVFGFIFMAGIPYKIDELIYSRGESSIANSLYAVGAMLLGGLLGTRLGVHMLTDTPARVALDGQDCGCDGFKLIVSTTIHRLLPLVAPTPRPLPASQERFAYLVNFMPRRELYAHVYSVFMDKRRGDPRHLTGHARSLELHDYVMGYSLDGEMVRVNQGANERVDLELSWGIPVRLWVAGGGGLLDG